MRDFKAPDYNAPRFRKSSYSLGSNEAKKLFFAAFYKKYPEYKHLSIKEVRAIIDDHCAKLAELIATTREGVELGEQIGIIFLGAMRIKKLKAINFGKSAKYGKTIRDKNLNQDGLLCKIYYSTEGSRYRMKGKMLWSFKAQHNLKDACSRNFRDNWELYVELTDKKKIYSQFYKIIRKEKYIREEEKAKIDYEDFDV